MRFISETIGEEYRNWRAGENILIDSPTGSGKSTFVLKKLLPYAIENGKSIVYLCNRKILNSQFTENTERELEILFKDAGGIPAEMRHAIIIVTYQFCEASKQFPNFSINSDLSAYSREQLALRKYKRDLPEPKELLSEDIMYYVFDEAHYFLSDSQFNFGTNYWFDKRFDNHCINIFLTATPEPFLTFLAARNRQFHFDEQIKKVHDLYIEKGFLRKEMEKPEYTIIVPKVGSGENAKLKVKFKKRRDIVAACREIKPYADFIEFLESQQKNLRYRKYTQNRCYDENISVFYFHKFDDIMSKLKTATSTNKWMVFVDSERTGISLEGRLNEHGIPTVLLSAYSIRKKCAAAEEFETITQTAHFDSQVLIATSVMDCGVSIVDSYVSNIVIAHHNKTTFLQMLGRKRLSDGEHINLYIKYYDAASINGVYHQYDKKLRYLTSYALLNSKEFVQKHAPTDTSDGMCERSILSKQSQQQAIQETQENGNIALLHTVPILPYHRDESIMKEYTYGRSAYISLIHGISDYIKALESYHSSNDPYFYLKWELSWIGKEYKEEYWLGYQESRDAIETFFNGKIGLWIEKKEQKHFSLMCLKLFLAMPVPPPVLQAGAYRYKGGEKFPGIHKLNSAIQQKKLSYKVISIQRGNGRGGRETFWQVIELD